MHVIPFRVIGFQLYCWYVLGIREYDNQNGLITYVEGGRELENMNSTKAIN